MTNWIKRSLLAVAGVGIAVGGIVACSYRGAHDHLAQPGDRADRFQQRMVEHASDELDLTAAQRQLLVALGDRMREQRQALVGTTTDPRAELVALVTGPRFDRTRAQALVDEKLAAVRGAAPVVLDAAAAFYDSLEPQQQQKLRDHVGTKRHRWHRHG